VIQRAVDAAGGLGLPQDGGIMSHPLLVFVCDAAYAMPLATTLRSIAETNRCGWPLEFHVLSSGFLDETRKKVLDSLPPGSASVDWISTDAAQYEGFSTLAHVSRITFARLRIPHVFSAASRILYLDTDLLVLDDLTSLWRTDLGGAVVGAVLDGLDSRLKSAEPGLDDVPRVRDYFNAGVLLIDLDLWRRERVSERAMDYLSRFPKTPYSDQDALNVVCDGRWKALDSRWNFQGHTKTRIADLPAEERPAIVHFVAVRKPWNPRKLNVNAPFYDAFRSRTRFARSLREQVGDAVRSLPARLERLTDRIRAFRRFSRKST
jgi:lipopolysaccharide biosynthesis glycosyltransferase